MTTTTDSPMTAVYGALEKAYDSLNNHLFEGELPRCLITLQRKRRVYGYFCGDRFADGEMLSEERDDDEVPRGIDEIALNPQYINLRDERATLSTLAHEMVHLWQHHFGKPTKTNPHNREWANKMKSIGLQPKGPRGEETGRNVSHVIVEGGLFATVAPTVLVEAPIAALGDMPTQSAPATKSGQYVKYTCATCGSNVRGKPGLKLSCDDHGPMVQLG